MRKLLLASLLASILTAPGIAAAVCDASFPETTPTGSFADNGDGTVTHVRTRLMWKKCSEGQTWNSGTNGCDATAGTYTWLDALSLVTGVNDGGGFAGHTDWRVPNIKELNSTVERQCRNPAVNDVVFPGAANGYYWSSSPFAPGSDPLSVGSNSLYAWASFMVSGASTHLLKSGQYHVRLVRDVPSLPPSPDL